MGGVEDNREPCSAQDRNRAHVSDQVVVTESSSALGDENLPAAGANRLFYDLHHLRRREKLALLEIYDPAGAHGGVDQVGLTAKKGGDLQHVHDFTGESSLRFRMHVGQHRHAERLSNFRQHLQSFVEAGSAKGFRRGAIGFVVAGFEDVSDVELPAGPPQRVRDFKAEPLVFDDTRPGDQYEAASRTQGLP